MRRLVRLAPWSWSLAVVLLFDETVFLEWSHPYCNAAHSGPAYAAFGFPLPYMEYGGVSSLEYLFMPHVFAFDVFVVFAAVFPLVRALLRTSIPARMRTFAAVIGFVACLLVVTFHIIVGTMMFVPVRSIALGEPDDAYAEYRPVGWTLGPHYECEPSEFWFGPRAVPGHSSPSSDAKR